MAETDCGGRAPRSSTQSERKKRSVLRPLATVANGVDNGSASATGSIAPVYRRIRLGRPGGDGCGAEARGRERVVPPVPVMIAGRALLLDVGHLAAGRDLPVLTGNAPARKRRVPEESNETHHASSSNRGRANPVPMMNCSSGERNADACPRMSGITRDFSAWGHAFAAG